MSLTEIRTQLWSGGFLSLFYFLKDKKINIIVSIQSTFLNTLFYLALTKYNKITNNFKI